MKECVNQEKYNYDDFLLEKKKKKVRKEREKENEKFEKFVPVSLPICTPTFIPVSYFNIDILVQKCVLTYMGCVSLMAQPTQNIEDLLKLLH